jgi:hypothetical protein
VSIKSNIPHLILNNPQHHSFVEKQTETSIHTIYTIYSQPVSDSTSTLCIFSCTTTTAGSFAGALQTFHIIQTCPIATISLTMSETASPNTPPRRGNRSRGRGPRWQRGGRSPGPQRGGIPGNSMQLRPNAAPLPDRTLITQTQYNETNGKAPIQSEDNVEEDGEVCFICASPVIHHAVAPCNHRTCHICSLRMRALYKNKACAHCRVSGKFRYATLKGILILWI